MLSDIHCSLSCTFHCKYVLDVDLNNDLSEGDVNNGTVCDRFLWKEDEAHLFFNECKQHIGELNDAIETSDIKEVNVKLVDLFISSAKKNGLLLKIKHGNTRKYKNKIWFNRDCIDNRKKYNRLRNIYMNNKTALIEDTMKSDLREYKAGIDKAKLEHRRLFVHKLRKHKHTNSRNYWKLLGEKKKNKANIPLNLLKGYFEKVYKDTSDDSVDSGEIDFNSNLPDWYNDPISKDEIMKAIKELKCNKAHGIDGVLNEYIKCTADLMIDIWVKLFNRILDSGEISSDWLIGIIITLYKGKGSHLGPNNYRGITLLSCVGKLFTSILNNRLNEFLNVYRVLNENQAGFREMYSTTHHIFTLKCLIDLRKFRKRKLFCAYVDYERVFDKINR